MSLAVKIISPIKTSFEGAADMVVLPGSEGEIGILPKHLPMIVSLKDGLVKIYLGKEIHPFAIKGGVAHITGSRVDVLSD